MMFVFKHQSMAGTNEAINAAKRIIFLGMNRGH